MRAIITTREGGAMRGPVKVLHDPLSLFLGPHSSAYGHRNVSRLRPFKNCMGFLKSLGNSLGWP